MPEAADEQRFETSSPVAIHWIHRDGREAGADNLILPTVAEIGFPPGEGFAFVAGEAQMAKMLRHHLVARGFNNDYIRAAGYWLRGEAGD